MYNKVGSFSAENRANAITEKIRKLYLDSFFQSDSLKIVSSDITQDIVYKGDFVIMSVLEIDAKVEKYSAPYIAKRNLALIKKAIIYQNENYSQLPKRLGYTALLILIIGIILFLVGKIFNKIKIHILRNSDKYFRGFNYNNITILSPQKQQFVIMRFYRFIKIIRFFFDEIKQENIKIDGFYSDWAMPTFNIVRFLMFAFMLVIIFPYLPESDSSIFKGVSVFVGVLFSLGSSNAIANMVAGLVITYMRPFKIGDVSGEVIEKTALVTRIRTPKFEDITIPNATVLSSTSTKFFCKYKGFYQWFADSLDGYHRIRCSVERYP
ncbi:MAG: mechanosensitive ion channel domain-containing protein [Flavobacterium sp.]